MVMESLENKREAPINYPLHFLVILMLLFVQYHIPDATVYLKMKYSRYVYSKKDGKEGAFYQKYEYVPISKKTDISPGDYEFAFVRSSNSITEEIYFFENGWTKTVKYVDRNWKSSIFTRGIVLKAFLFLPMIGFILFLGGTLRKSARTRSLFTWQMMKHPYERFEKICLIYGFSLFISAIVFGHKVPGPP